MTGQKSVGLLAVTLFHALAGAEPVRLRVHVIPDEGISVSTARWGLAVWDAAGQKVTTWLIKRDQHLDGLGVGVADNIVLDRMKDYRVGVRVDGTNLWSKVFRLDGAQGQQLLAEVRITKPREPPGSLTRS